MTHVDFTALSPVSELRGGDEQETRELRALADAAERYIRQFEWCAGVKRMFTGIAIPKVLGVFLTEVQPARPDVDRFLWVIVGDLPSAYLVTDDAPTAPSALTAYVELMGEWVDAVRTGASTVDLIPVNVEPTAQFASMLDSRLRFISERVIPEYSG